MVLAEMECESQEEVERLLKPEFAAEDVTVDPYFRGGNLVTLTSQELRKELEKRKGKR